MFLWDSNIIITVGSLCYQKQTLIISAMIVISFQLSSLQKSVWCGMKIVALKPV